MNIPDLPIHKLSEIFVEGALFGAIDSNLETWLQNEWPETKAVEVESSILDEHKDNSELIELLGGEEKIAGKHLFTPGQIRYLAEKDALQTNGLSNLFFIQSTKEPGLFIIGVVWDNTIERFVPYIYRTRNLYRAWTRGNKVFLKSNIQE